MNKIEKFICIFGVIFLILTEIFIIYTRMNDNYKLETAIEKVEKQQVEIENLKYLLETNKDTIYMIVKQDKENN